MVSASSAPLRLAIVDDYAVVVAGVASLLAAQRVDVVETAASTAVVSDVDIVLFDTCAQVQGGGLDLEDFVRDSGARVVVFSWNLQPDLVDRAITQGACGYLSKALDGEQILDALERVRRGEIVVDVGDRESSVGASGNWPGRDAGLSPREAEILALITLGLTNVEIAERSYVSINSVKTYIRAAYRKIGVTRRSQAVRWAMEHHFESDTLRLLDASLETRPPTSTP